MRKFVFPILVVWLCVLAVPLVAQETPTSQPSQNQYRLPELYARGTQAGLDQDYERSILDLSTFILFNPTASVAYFARAINYTDIGELELALKDYDRTLELGLPRLQQMALAHYGRANLLVQMSNTSAALLDLDASIDLNPDFPQSYFLRGSIYEAQGKLQDALADYSRVIELNPEFTAAYEARIEVNRLLGNLDAVMEDYDHLAEVNSDDPQVIFDRAFANEEQQNWDAALADYNRVIALDPENASAYTRRGVVNSALGNLEAAVEDFSQTILLQPDDPEAYYYRGLLNRNLDQLEAAVADFTRVVELVPDFPNGYFNRAVINQALGKVSEALSDYQQVIRLLPEDPNAYFARARLYTNQRRFEDALADYDRVVELAPDLADAYLARGFIYSVFNETAKAADDLFHWTELIQVRSIDGTELASGESVQVNMEEGWVYRILFAAEAGQQATIYTTSSVNEVDPLLVLLDGDNVPLAGNDDSGGNLDAAIANFILPSDGMYTIIVSHARGGSTGAVTVTLELSTP